MVKFYFLQVPDYKFALSNIYILYKCVCMYVMYKNARYRSRFEPIFIKFVWSVRVLPRMNPIVFGKTRPDRTTNTYLKKMCPHNCFPCSIQTVRPFSEHFFFFFWFVKNLKAVFPTSFPTKKVFFILLFDVYFFTRTVVLSKSDFSRVFRKILLFLEKIVK